MSTPAIRVDKLSKQYQIGIRGNGYTTFREALWGFVTSPLQRLSSLSGRGKSDEFFWALKDVSFDVEPGEVVGIIGRNGAGKTTLLKILSQITEPTSGYARFTGRMSSLLEVGTGFHPELTGRENVYLNGAILGMTRTEVRRKFDEIVEFSGVERFLDTPVKRYSSGMAVRLAFSVAAHLEPDILIIDEVLAVGDSEFQKKCLGKMESFSNSGRTILFVSHNVAAINCLCTRCILLRAGSVVADGTVSSTVSKYFEEDGSLTGETQWAGGIANPGVTDFRFLGVRLLNDNAQTTAHFCTNERMTVELRFEIRQELGNCQVGFTVKTADGTPAFEVYDTDALNDIGVRKPGTSILTCSIPCSQLLPHSYRISINAGIPSGKRLAAVDGAIGFMLHDSVTARSKAHLPRAGVMRPEVKWGLRSQS